MIKKAATALITGAGARLGKHFAEHLAAQGYNLALHYHTNSQGVEQLKQQLTTSTLQQQDRAIDISLHQCDFSQPEQASSLIEQARAAHQGGIALLINNASIFPAQELGDCTANDLMHCYAINCFTPLLLMQAMSQDAQAEHIVNILDTRVHHKHPERAIYSLSKQTLQQATLRCAKELAPALRVNGICPGAVLPAADSDAEQLAQIVLSTPLQQQVTVKDILQALDYLNTNTRITGEILCVDSGQHLH